MLPDSATRIVSSGLPGGGATGRTIVGLSKIISAVKIPAPINPTAPIQRDFEIPPGRDRAYQTQSTAPAMASTNHSDDGISGSTVNPNSFSPRRRRAAENSFSFF